MPEAGLGGQGIEGIDARGDEPVLTQGHGQAGGGVGPENRLGRASS